MKTFANPVAWLGALAATCCLVTSCAKQETVDPTAQMLADRQQILDQITRYYYNFGRSDRQAEETFYAEDGVLILGTRRFEGREGIKSAYTRPPPAAAAGAAPAAGGARAEGAAPAAAAPAAPPAAPAPRPAFNVTVDNPLVIVHGDTATSQVIFTEYREERTGDPPRSTMRMTTQGKEYATWVKVDGKWLYKSRQIAGGSQPPEGWTE
jgi:hypothetical protein